MKTDLKQKREYQIRCAQEYRGVYWKSIGGYRVEIPGFEDYVFFVHRGIGSDGYDWRVSEIRTGRSLPSDSAKTRQLAVNNAIVYMQGKDKTKFTEMVTQLSKSN